MRDAVEQRTGCAPVAGVSKRRAMRDAKEEGTGSVPVAGVVCWRRATPKAEDERNGCAPWHELLAKEARCSTLSYEEQAARGEQCAMQGMSVPSPRS